MRLRTVILAGVIVLLFVVVFGCASKRTPPSPVDDRIGSLKEHTDVQNKAIDDASASNKTTLDYFRQGRDFLRKHFQ